MINPENPESTPEQVGTTQADIYRTLQDNPEARAEQIHNIRYLLDRLTPAIDTVSNYDTREAATIREKLAFLDMIVRGVTEDVVASHIPAQLFPEAPDLSHPKPGPDSDDGRSMTSAEKQLAYHMNDLIKGEDSLERARQILEDYLRQKADEIKELLSQLEAQTGV